MRERRPALRAHVLSDALDKILDSRQRAERLATGFGFTEGPLWHPDGFYYFVDIRANTLFRITPGKAPEVAHQLLTIAEELEAEARRLEGTSGDGAD